MTRPKDILQKEDPNSELCRAGWPQGKSKGKQKRNEYIDLARELKNCET